MGGRSSDRPSRFRPARSCSDGSILPAKTGESGNGFFNPQAVHQEHLGPGSRTGVQGDGARGNLERLGQGTAGLFGGFPSDRGSADPDDQPFCPHLETRTRPGPDASWDERSCLRRSDLHARPRNPHLLFGPVVFRRGYNHGPKARTGTSRRPPRTPASRGWWKPGGSILRTSSPSCRPNGGRRAGGRPPQ